MTEFFIYQSLAYLRKIEPMASIGIALLFKHLTSNFFLANFTPGSSYDLL